MVIVADNNNNNNNNNNNKHIIMATPQTSGLVLTENVLVSLVFFYG